MRRILACLFLLALASLACNIAGTATPPVATAAPGTTEAAPTNTPEPALPTNTPAPPPPNASCGKLSLYIPPALGTSYGCQTFPESGNLDLPPFGINPQYSEITISGYPLADRFMSPQIDIYPVQRYHELLTDLVDSRVAALQTLLGGGLPGTAALPVLPIQNAAQFFIAQYAVVPFQIGSGIRYITEYGQAFYPINNHDMWLSYQALTADGQYWISMILPMSHPSLPANGDTPPGGDWNAFYDTAEAYFAQTATALNAQAPDSFVPSIVQVDAMINSMVVTP